MDAHSGIWPHVTSSQLEVYQQTGSMCVTPPVGSAFDDAISIQGSLEVAKTPIRHGGLNREQRTEQGADCTTGAEIFRGAG